jgi:hypothetical protein
MRFTIGRLITALVLLATTAAAVWALMPRPISVETATVTRGKFVATVDEDGKTPCASVISWRPRFPGVCHAFDLRSVTK